MLQGKCFGHPNPDLWFTDTSDAVGAGGPMVADGKRRVLEALTALAICDVCPLDAKSACLALGMRPENIDNGIWGGVLSGERIKESSKVTLSNDRKARIAFAEKVREAQRSLV